MTVNPADEHRSTANREIVSIMMPLSALHHVLRWRTQRQSLKLSPNKLTLPQKHVVYTLTQQPGLRLMLGLQLCSRAGSSRNSSTRDADLTSRAAACRACRAIQGPWMP